MLTMISKNIEHKLPNNSRMKLHRMSITLRKTNSISAVNNYQLSGNKIERPYSHLCPIVAFYTRLLI